MTDVAIVLVHGPCGTPGMWSRLVPYLDETGVTNVAVHLPSSLPESELDDAPFLRSVLDGREESIVLVGHSSGGLPITEVGDHPSVAHLVFLDACLVDAGESVAALLAGQIDEKFGVFWRRREGVTWADPDALLAYLAAEGWPDGDAREFASGWAPSRQAAQVREITVATWRHVPSTFVWCTESAMSSELQGYFASRAGDVVKLPGDHFPQWRRPAEVADVLTRIAHTAGSA
jgi:pimeloyl-ACP methyl ester carboxylesterase